MRVRKDDGGTNKAIPVVDPNDLIKIHEKVHADTERFGSSDVMVSAVSLFHGKLQPNEILNISHRLFALANFVIEGEGDQWLMKETGAEYVLVNEALLRAAARAPLTEAEYIKDIRFEKETFLPIALQEAETKGKA